MILEFSVQNFGSIKERQTLSFVADKSSHLDNYYIIEQGKFRILKLAVLYGANASGKTFIVRALDFLRDLAIDPIGAKNKELAFEPFLLDRTTPRENTHFSINFLQNDVHYLYEIECNRKSVVSEALYFYSSRKKIAVFTRTTDLERQITNIVFGDKVAVDPNVANILQGNTLWNNSVLGGSFKTNIDQKEIKDATDWFSNYLKPMIAPRTNLGDFVTNNIQQDKVDKAAIIEILKKADFCVSDILIKESEEDMPESLLKLLDSGALPIPKDQADKIRETKKITSVDYRLEHTVDGVKYDAIEFDKESFGTQRYYGLGGILYMTIKDRVAFMIDELESSLHPDLYKHLILSFLANAKHSQLIVTTHNRELLGHRDMFRTDAIWITQRNQAAATELYSLSDFDSATIRDTTNVLNAYKTGKLGGIPRLGDTYLDFDDQKSNQ